MDENYSPDIFTLSDDEGNEFTFEVLDELEDGDNYYVAMQPVYDDPKDQLDDNGELVIMKSCEDNGEEFFEEIEDEEEFDRIASVFTTRLGEIFDIEQ